MIDRVEIMVWRDLVDLIEEKPSMRISGLAKKLGIEYVDAVKLVNQYKYMINKYGKIVKGYE